MASDKTSLQARLIAAAKLQNGDKNYIFPQQVEGPILQYIRTLSLDPQVKRDLIQEARAAMWAALANRSKKDCYDYLISTGMGAIKKYLQRKHVAGLARVPAYLHDRHKAGEHYLKLIELDEESAVGENE